MGLSKSDSTIYKISDEIPVDLNKVTEGEFSADFHNSSDSIQLCDKQGTKENLWKAKKYNLVTTQALP